MTGGAPPLGAPRLGAPPLGALGARDEAPAIVEPGRGAVSYAALDALADGVAARLRARGVAPGARVGVYLSRSADAIAAILGVLRAGCAYVPVDPRAPGERNAEIHADCEVAAALVEERFAPGYADALRARGRGAALEVVGEVGLGRAIGAWASNSATNSASTPGEIACVLYTSGSTGRHKGWLMSRAAVEAHVAWVHDLLRPSRADVFANHAQLAFGMSLFDVFSSLSCGAPLVLVPEEARLLPRPLAELLARERVSIWFSGPAILGLLSDLDGLERYDLSALRFVAFAGEAFQAAPLNKLRARVPHPRYFNLYGSTETNVAAFHELPRGEVLDGPPPIGRACAHYESRLVEGELQLRGIGLTTGYLGQPELTAERLVEGGWYRTMDLAVELPGGELRLAGRLGRMVKVRGGFRVEPGEVEARLREHPEVKEAAVVPEEGARGVGLVAHVRGKVAVVELKEFCARRLPAYMVPERVVFYEGGLPRNLRGKVDLEGLRGG